LACSSRSEAIAATLSLALLLSGPAAGAPDDPLVLESLRGDSVRVLPEAGSTVLLHFWASWCPSCVDELPMLETAAAACAGGGLRVLAVNVGEDVETIARFYSPSDAGLQLVRDPRGRVWRAVSGVGLPVNLFWTVGEQRVDVGPRSQPEWVAAFEELGCRME